MRKHSSFAQSVLRIVMWPILLEKTYDADTSRGNLAKHKRSYSACAFLGRMRCGLGRETKGHLRGLLPMTRLGNASDSNDVEVVLQNASDSDRVRLALSG